MVRSRIGIGLTAAVITAVASCGSNSGTSPTSASDEKVSSFSAANWRHPAPGVFINAGDSYAEEDPAHRPMVEDVEQTPYSAPIGGRKTRAHFYVWNNTSQPFTGRVAGSVRSNGSLPADNTVPIVGLAPGGVFNIELQLPAVAANDPMQGQPSIRASLERLPDTLPPCYFPPCGEPWVEISRAEAPFDAVDRPRAHFATSLGDVSVAFPAQGSVAMTGASVPAALRNGNTTFADPLLDARSDLVLLGASTETPLVSGNALFEPDGPPVPWAQAQYTRGNGGSWQRADVSGLLNGPAKTLRRVDHGLCHAPVGLDAIGQQVGETIRGGIMGASLYCRNLTVKTATGVILAQNPGDDQLYLDIGIDGRAAWRPPIFGCDGFFGAAEDVHVHFRLLIGLAAQGGKLVSSLGKKDYRPYSFLENKFMTGIVNDFGPRLAGAIASNLVIPATYLGGPPRDDYTTCDPAAPDCLGAARCFVPDPDNYYVLSPRAATYDFNMQLAAQKQGVCAWVMTPKSVNILPQALDLGLIVDAADPLYGLVQTLAVVGGQQDLICKPNEPMVTPGGLLMSATWSGLAVDQ